MPGPLTGIKVVDLTTNISGPSLTMILADLGAEVIKVEKPNIGDDSRKMDPLMVGEGVYYLNINRNKRSIVIDLKTETGKEIVYDLVKKADIFVENFRYGKAAELGFDYETLKQLNQQIIYCSLSAYGQHGSKRHKPGYDAIVQGETGIIGINGTENGGMARAAVSILDQGSAMWGAIGILSALFYRTQTGIGQKVDTSLYETGIFWMGYHILSYLATGNEPQKMGTNHPSFAPYGDFQTADDPIMIGISNDSLFARLCKVLNKEKWITDPRFRTNLDRVRNRKELSRSIELVLKQKPAKYWINELDKGGIPCSIIQKVSQVINDPQIASTDMLVYVEHPTIPRLKITRIPVQLSETRLEITKHPPRLGEDTVEILTELGYDQQKIQDLFERGIVQGKVKAKEETYE